MKTIALILALTATAGANAMIVCGPENIKLNLNCSQFNFQAGPSRPA